jgi:hypothetical protein
LGETQKSGVVKFLIEFKKIMVTGRGLDIVPRRENLDALSDLGLTRNNLKEEILALSVQDYCEGPEPDKDRPGEIWIFGKQVAGKEIYIKLKIAQVGKEKIAKCLSFHPANFPLCFPYHDKKGGI